MPIDADAVLDGLSRLIAEERRALKGGDLGRLPAIAAAKERLLSGLASAPEAFDRRRLAGLRVEAEGLGALLQAAARGVAAARARLDTARSAAHRLDTYDARGRALTVAARSSTVELRA